MAQWASAFAEKGLGISKALGDLLGPCLFAVVMGICRMLHGKWGEKMPLAKLLLASGGLCIVSYLICGLSQNPVFSLVGCVLCGVSVSVLWPGVISMASQKRPTGGTALFALLDGADNVTIYAKRSTIYKHLVGMVDESGRPIFQPNAQAGASGTLLGATIKIEDAVADGVILAGDPSKFVYNMVQDIMVETDRDIKRHVITHSGYARGEGALIVPNAFAQLTV
jgi:hypothetical protein